VTPPRGQKVGGSSTQPRDPREAAGRAAIDRHDNGQAHLGRTGVDRNYNGQAQYESTPAHQVIDVEEDQVREAMRRSQLESEVVEVCESDEEDGNTEREYNSDMRSAIKQSRRDAQRQAWLKDEDPEMQEALERSRLESDTSTQTRSETGGSRGGAGPGPISVSSIRSQVPMVVESSKSDGVSEGEGRARKKICIGRSPPAHQSASTLGGTSGTALCGWHCALCQTVRVMFVAYSWCLKTITVDGVVVGYCARFSNFSCWFLSRRLS
jgi:hypothetical protein